MFRNVSRLFFPLSLGNLHWVLFEVNPSNLQQMYFDSLWSKMGETSTDVSQLIHQFLCDYHEKSLGKPHRNICPWHKEMVLDNHTEIRTVKQT